MGCDVHPYIARRTGQGTLEPVMYGSLDLGRDYLMFGLMAGVRGTARLFAPRGLPDGVPFPYKFDHDRMEGDARSASWLTTAEVGSVAAAHTVAAAEQRGGRSESLLLAALLGLMDGVDRWCDAHDPGGGAVLIFWFDN